MKAQQRRPRATRPALVQAVNLHRADQ
jgi:hypothetical protein